MRLPARLALFAALAALTAPVASSDGAEATVVQDIVVSAAAGAAGDQITVSSASCVPDPAEEIDRQLSVRLIAGTAPSELLAGGGVGHPAKVVIPDWIAPGDPAVIEASCIESDESGYTIFQFDPVPFDVLPATGPPVQDRTFSRTSALVGQAITVSGTGCTLPGATYGAVEVIEGADLSGRTQGGVATFANADLAGEDFSVPLALLNGRTGVSTTTDDQGHPLVDEVQEIPTTIAPGRYTANSYCGTDDGTLLLFKPQLLDLTGIAPISDIELTVPAQSHAVELTGRGCAQGPVTVGLRATAASGEVPTTSAGATDRIPLDPTGTGSRRADLAGLLVDDDDVVLTVDPDADGTWSVSDQVGFDEGIVESHAYCGDPLGGGFIYDPQIAVVHITSDPPATTTTLNPTTTTTTRPHATTTTTTRPHATTTTTTVVPGPPPSPPPARSVAGSPAYTG